MKAIDVRGAINGTTAYVDGELKARNTTITLPEVSHVIATIQSALGEMDVPLLGLVESMEATIQKIGVDKGLASMLRMEQKTFEFRWAQQISKTDGTNGIEGCKAFIRGIPKIAVPQIEVTPGESVELDLPLSVSRYQLYVGGDEVCLIDKLAGICRINGIDYASQLDNLL